MLEPQNDEERKALRLAKVMWDSECIDEHDVRLCMSVLAEARAIVREEQSQHTTAGAMSDPVLSRELELAAVRADITRTAAVVQALALHVETYFEHAPHEHVAVLNAQAETLRWLLSRERELMAKSEPEGGAK